ncbi:MAG: hypothetical protein IJ168_04860 [Eubacterium sp.]|nr:hypothetical protein [Eubacterium sp.]
MKLRQWLSEAYLYLVMIGVVAACGVIHLTGDRIGIPGSQALSSLLYILLFTVWMFSIRRRFIQHEVRRNMTFFAVLMIVWTLLRAIKYELTLKNTFIDRQLWYWYYVPLLLMPLIMFLSVLYLGKSETYMTSRRWYWLLLPVLVMMGLVVTNDLHQLAFAFQPDLLHWNGDYAYGPVYYAVAGFFFVSILAILIAVFKVGVRRRFVKYSWMPLLVIALCLFYWANYAGGNAAHYVILRVYKMPELVCLGAMLFWESLALAHLIPTNSHYQDFFAASTIKAGLTDNAYRVVLNPIRELVPSPHQVQQAQRTPVPLQDGSLLLKSYKIKGGYFYWLEDISKILRLNRELSDTEDYLIEENALLDAANALEESRRTTAQQNELYDRIARQIRPQLEKVQAMLETLPEEEEAFRFTMKQAAVLSAFIKRYSNLLLLTDSSEKIDLDELGIAMAESLEYVKLLDIDCFCETEQGYTVDGRVALLLYELFENALEQALPGALAVLTLLQIQDGMLRFYMEISAPSALPEAAPYAAAVASLGGKLTAELNDGVSYITVLLPGGDGA